jgi:hypothetical protein
MREKIANYRKVNITLPVVFAGLIASFLWLLHSFALPDVTRANEQLALDRGGVRIEQARVVADFVRCWRSLTSQCFTSSANGGTQLAGTICGRAIRARKVTSA